MNDISIIICTKGRHDLLEKTVDHLQSIVSEDKYLEIVVVEETNYPQPLRGKKLRYYSIPERGQGLGFTRNIGLKKASGSIIVFIDDDVFPAEDWFENLLEPFKDEEVGAVGGAVFPDWTDINTVGKCISFLGFPAGGIKRYIQTSGRNYETNLLSTGNCAFRAKLARKLGGFDTLLRWCGEDQDLFFRISSMSKTLFIPGAVVFHRQRDTLRRVFLWFVRRGKGKFVMKSKRMNPLLALILPLRANFLFKVLGFIVISTFLLSTSPFAFLLFFVITYVIWNTILWQREYAYFKNSFQNTSNGKLFSLQDGIPSKKVVITLPIVKFCMDLGREMGRILAFFRYMYHRVLCKPLVLTFHHLAPLNQRSNHIDSKYYYSKEALEKILADSDQENWWVMPLTEIVRRLKEYPSSLYFEKILALTFDDGYASTYEALNEILLKQKYAFTVFVPTNLASASDGMESPEVGMRERVMNWHQIKSLKEMGVEIGSHTRNHINLLEAPKQSMMDEIRGSLEDLKDNFPTKDVHRILFSYPYGAHDQEVIRLVKEAGFFGAVANFQGNIRPKTDPWQIPRFTVSAGNDWVNVRRRARSLSLKELIKDFRDLVFR